MATKKLTEKEIDQLMAKRAKFTMMLKKRKQKASKRFTKNYAKKPMKFLAKYSSGRDKPMLRHVLSLSVLPEKMESEPL